jgi:hypothetical protein
VQWAGWNVRGRRSCAPQLVSWRCTSDCTLTHSVWEDVRDSAQRKAEHGGTLLWRSILDGGHSCVSEQIHRHTHVGCVPVSNYLPWVGGN